MCSLPESRRRRARVSRAGRPADRISDAESVVHRQRLPSPADVCPVTEAELELANLLTIMTMNEGMASTFVPFKCS